MFIEAQDGSLVNLDHARQIIARPEPSYGSDEPEWWDVIAHYAWRGEDLEDYAVIARCADAASARALLGEIKRIVGWFTLERMPSIPERTEQTDATPTTEDNNEIPF